MSHPPRNLRKNNNIKSVSVARTVESPQPETEKFLNLAGERVGRRGRVFAITSTRVTILESAGIRKAITQSSVEPHEVGGISYWLSCQLDVYRAVNLTVGVNPNKPLILLGRNYNKLALNLYPDEDLVKERRRTEHLIKSRFGNLPSLKPFRPHITIAQLSIAQLIPDELENPDTILGDNVCFPEHIVLNGLAVMLNGKQLKH